MEKHKIIKRIAVLAGVFLLTVAALYLLLAAACAIPNEKIAENMEKSSLSYKTADAFAFEEKNALNSVADNYADTILLGISWNMGKGNPFVSALDTKYNDGGEKGENYGLFVTVTENAEPNKAYTRYFHGTAGLVRLMHLFTDVGGIKTAGFIAIILLLLAVVAVLIKKKHFHIAAAFVLSLILVQIWNVCLSLEYQSTFVLCFIFCILFMLSEKKSDSTLVYLSVISGAATAFFDFLTTETVTVLMPLMLVFAIRAAEGREKSFKEMLKASFACGAAWLLAYGGTFLVKWTVVTVVTGTNAFGAAFASALERLGGEVFMEEKPTFVFSALLANLAMLSGTASRNNGARGIITSAIFALIVFSLWYLKRARETKKNTAYILLLLGAMVPVRYLILNNHSFLHSFFTYRALCSTIFALLCAAMLNMQLKSERKGRKP